ncbi:MAG: amylo-alpha-1,6-glucosidase [Armatimonadota bacterium]
MSIKFYETLPDVWSEGALFAYSGIDGPTCTASGFVATLLEKPFGLLIHTPMQRMIRFMLKGGGHVDLVTGDLTAMITTHGNFGLAYNEWHTIIGHLPELAEVRVIREFGLWENLNGVAISVDEATHDAVVMNAVGSRLAICYGDCLEQAMGRLDEALKLDFETVAIERMRFASGGVDLINKYQALLVKCLSVMKVNTLWPEGAITRRWSTPDRVPHRHMWMWDSMFHALGMLVFDCALAWDYVDAVLDTQQDDGMIPHMYRIDGTHSEITQPPLLAWAVREVEIGLTDPQCLQMAYPKLLKYLKWYDDNRRDEATGLYYWHINEDANNRCDESGMDNSPRFDGGERLLAVDLCCYLVNEWANVAIIAERMKLDDEATQAWQRSEQLEAMVLERMWNEKTGFYHDVRPDGSFSPVLAVSGFLPLLLPTLPKTHLASLLKHLDNPMTFGTRYPVPSVAANDPSYGHDMWRGATWVNMNWMIHIGLRLQKKPKEARKLAKATIDAAEAAAKAHGVIFEYMDSTGKTPPTLLDRKGKCENKPYLVGKMDSVRDYHWSAALLARMIVEVAKVKKQA